MSRYEWPDDLRKPPETLAGRAESNRARRRQPATSGGFGDLDALSRVIDAGFDPDRRWMPLGPAILRKGQASGDPIVSGRVRDIRVHSNGMRAYVATANGGVWYTGTAGADWIPLGSWALTADALRDDLILTFGALLVEWGLEDDGTTDAPHRDVVYAGTGEIKPFFNGTPGGKHAGIGVLRLSDTVGAIEASPGGNPWRREAANLTGVGIYRLAQQPGTPLGREDSDRNTLVAATSQGLYLRNGPFAEDADWSFVDFADGEFDQNDGVACTDVLWSEHGLFVTLMGAGEDHDGVWHSVTGPGGSFDRIALPDHDIGSRLSLAASPIDGRRIYVVGKRSPPPVEDAIGLAHGWLIDLSHTPGGDSGPPVAALGIGDWPLSLYSSKVTKPGSHYLIFSDQSNYDQAVTVVDDGGADVLYVGGKGSGSKGWVFRLPITGTAAAGDLSAGVLDANQLTLASDPTFEGRGIHADIHVLRASGADLWVGCDGGVFTRTQAGGGTARSLNAGLPTTEPGYLSSHPVHDGHLIAGLQDNGFVQSTGAATWELVGYGDGGGCAHHPSLPHMVLKQYTGASWDFIPARTPRGPAHRNPWNSLWDSEESENKRASFYSAPLVLPGPTGDTARVFVGTHRLWMSDDWGPSGTMTWQTIPSGTDPHPLTATPAAGVGDDDNDIRQDRLISGEKYDPVLVIEALSPGSGDGFIGTRLLVLCRYSVRIFELFDDGGTPTWTKIEDSIVSGRHRKDKKMDRAVPDPFLSFLPRFEDTHWNDVAPHTTRAFYVATTGRTQRADDGTLTPDPDFDTLWWFDGTDRWYPTGLRSTLPDEAAGTSGTPVSAHAVLVDPDTPDIVWVGTRIGVFEGRIDQSDEHPSWTWRPIMDGLPQALVEDLSLFRSGARRYLRAAVVSLGVWERDVSETPHSVGRSYVRSISFDTGRAELPDALSQPMDDPSRLVRIDQSPDIVVSLIQPFVPPSLPDEAWFASASHTRSVLNRAGYHAWVLVHHRDTTELFADQMRVNLFTLTFPDPLLDADALDLDPPTRSAIVNSVASDGSPRDFPVIGLRYAGRQVPAGPLSARKARSVHFDLDMTRLSAGASGRDRVAVIAVIDPEGRPFDASHIEPAPGDSSVTLGQILRRSPYVAARTFQR